MLIFLFFDRVVKRIVVFIIIEFRNGRNRLFLIGIIVSIVFNVDNLDVRIKLKIDIFIIINIVLEIYVYCKKIIVGKKAVKLLYVYDYDLCIWKI